MTNLRRAVLLLVLGLSLMAPAVMAQDALSPILPSPYTARLGSQLVYFWEEGTSATGRTPFKSFLTITNANITLTVTVHFQIYQVVAGVASQGNFTCLELFDWIDVLTPGQRYIIDPANIRRAAGGSLVGQATNGRFMMTASAIFVGAVPTGFADLRLISYNFLTGQNWMSDTVRGITRMNNAIVRMGVDANGGPAPTGVLLLGSAGVAAAGATGCPGVAFSCTTGIGPTYLQLFRPILLIVNSFFRTANPNAVQQGVPFGNRMTVFSVRDEYFGTEAFFRFRAENVTLTGFVFDDAENPFSITPRFANCVNEWTLAPDTANATGNFADFIGAGLNSAVANTGGWLRLTVSPLLPNQNVFGLFSQGLSFTVGSTTLGFGGGDLMIGVGRQGQAGLVVTTSLNGVVVTGSGVGTTF